MLPLSCAPKSHFSVLISAAPYASYSLTPRQSKSQPPWPEHSSWQFSMPCAESESNTDYRQKAIGSDAASMFWTHFTLTPLVH
eukprot:842140-Amphidinium_carterae.1